MAILQNRPSRFNLLGQASSLHNVVPSLLSLHPNLLLIHGHQPPTDYDLLPVNNNQLDIASRDRVDHSTGGGVVRLQMNMAHIDRDEIRLLADFKTADVCV